MIKILKKIKFFWQNNEIKFITAIGLIVVAILSFEAGYLKGKKWQEKPLILEKSCETQAISQTSTDLNTQKTTMDVQASTEESSAIVNAQNVQSKSTENKQICAFVGSKNSNKYHLSSCRWAKKIKPENVVCFENEQEAVKRGYQPCGTCIKK